MALRSDHKALMFIGAVAVLGAGVRVVRAASGQPAAASQPALERQQRAADSAARAGRGGKDASGKGRGKRATSRGSRDSAGRQASDPVRERAAAGPLDHRGYVRGKLDLDIATAAQIDSLPGVSAAMSRRIVLDRGLRGPFITKDGLRRVHGAGPAFVAKIDSLVMFSGTIIQPTAGDTALANVTRRPLVRSRPQ